MTDKEIQETEYQLLGLIELIVNDDISTEKALELAGKIDILYKEYYQESEQI